MKKRVLAKNKFRKHKYKKQKILKFQYIFIGMVTFFTLVFALGFYFRNTIGYYYSIYFNHQKHQNLTNSLYEKQRITRIIEAHSDKLFGFDISHYQSKEAIQWNNLFIEQGNIPLSFVILRATMGSNGKDKHFSTFWKKAKEHQLIRGAYHFYRPDEDPVAQAYNFLNKIHLEKGDLIPILDIEKSSKKISQQKLNENLKIWLKIVEEKYGKKPIIYTFYHYYKDYLRQDFKEYPLWIANYNNLLEPSPSDTWQIWQFTEQGIVHGINTKIDLNIFNGRKTTLKKLLIE